MIATNGMPVLVIQWPRHGFGNRYLAYVRVIVATYARPTSRVTIMNATKWDESAIEGLRELVAYQYPICTVINGVYNPVNLGATTLYPTVLWAIRNRIRSTYLAFADIYGADEVVLSRLPVLQWRMVAGSESRIEISAGTSLLCHTACATPGEINVDRIRITSKILSRQYGPSFLSKETEMSKASRPSPTWYERKPYRQSLPASRASVSWSSEYDTMSPPVPWSDSMMEFQHDEHGIPFQANGRGYRWPEGCDGFRNGEHSTALYGCMADEASDYTVRQRLANDTRVRELISLYAQKIEQALASVPTDTLIYTASSDETHRSGLESFVAAEDSGPLGKVLLLFYPSRRGESEYWREGDTINIPVPRFHRSGRSIMYWRLLPIFTGPRRFRFRQLNGRNPQRFDPIGQGMVISRVLPFFTYNHIGVHGVGGGSLVYEGGILNAHVSDLETLFANFSYTYGTDELYFYQYEPLSVNYRPANFDLIGPHVRMAFPTRACRIDEERGWGVTNFLRLPRFEREEIRAAVAILNRPSVPVLRQTDLTEAQQARVCQISMQTTMMLLNPQTTPVFRYGDVITHEGMASEVDILAVERLFDLACSADPHICPELIGLRARETVTLATYGSHGDRVPVLALAKRASAMGQPVVVWDLLSRTDGLTSLRLAEENSALAQMSWITRARALLASTRGTVYAPIAICPAGATSYSLAPHESRGRPIRPGLGLSFLDWVVRFMYATTPPDRRIGYFRGLATAPRSADGTGFLGQRRFPDCDRRVKYYASGSSSIPPPPGFIPPEAIPLPRGDHEALLRHCEVLYCPGGEGIVATALAAGAKVRTWDKRLDRDRKEGLATETAIRGNHPPLMAYAWFAASSLDGILGLLYTGEIKALGAIILETALDLNLWARLTWIAFMVWKVIHDIGFQPSAGAYLIAFLGNGQTTPLIAIMTGAALTAVSTWIWAERGHLIVKEAVLPFARYLLWNLTSAHFPLAVGLVGPAPALLTSRALSVGFQILGKQVERLHTFLLADVSIGSNAFLDGVVYVAIVPSQWMGIPILHMELRCPSRCARVSIATPEGVKYSLGVPITMRTYTYDPATSSAWHYATGMTYESLQALSGADAGVYSVTNTCQTITLVQASHAKTTYLTAGALLTLAATSFSSGLLALAALGLILGMVPSIDPDVVAALYQAGPLSGAPKIRGLMDGYLFDPAVKFATDVASLF
uniref:ORF1 n=1 Tax=Ceratobasidium hypovirus A TaxID=1964427 RepID=A0A288QF59_9VIRU|nr:ORF1 [Ceratobasidium hypovirus A]